MKTINIFLSKYFNIAVLILLLFILFRSCGNESRIINKRLDKLSQKVDSLSAISASRRDIQIEGLKAEKRMIQSTDRKMLDVNRQSEIDKEIELLK